MLTERMENLFKDNSIQMTEFYTISMKAIPRLSFKGQAMALEFAEKMVSQVEQKQQVEFVKLALDMDLVTQGAETTGNDSKKATVRFFRYGVSFIVNLPALKKNSYFLFQRFTEVQEHLGPARRLFCPFESLSNGLSKTIRLCKTRTLCS